MLRYVSAFVLYNVLCFCLLYGFEYTVPIVSQFLGSEIEAVPIVVPWGDHYIFKLVSIVTALSIASILTGAVSRKNGGIVTVLSGTLISSLFLLEIFFLFYTDYYVPAELGFQTVASIAWFFSVVLPFFCGRYGEHIQRRFPNRTILGIKPIHFLWLVVPIVFYSMLILVHSTVSSVILVESFFHEDESLPGLMNFITVLPVLADIFVLYVAYNLLIGELMIDKSPTLRTLASAAVLTIGFPVTWLIERIAYSLL